MGALFLLIKKFLQFVGDTNLMFNDFLYQRWILSTTSSKRVYCILFQCHVNIAPKLVFFHIFKDLAING